MQQIERFFASWERVVLEVAAEPTPAALSKLVTFFAMNLLGAYLALTSAQALSRDFFYSMFLLFCSTVTFSIAELVGEIIETNVENLIDDEGPAHANLWQ